MDRPDLCLFLELETETILYFFYERPEKVYLLWKHLFLTIWNLYSPFLLKI